MLELNAIVVPIQTVTMFNVLPLLNLIH